MEISQFFARFACDYINKMLSYHRETALHGAVVLAKSGID